MADSLEFQVKYDSLTGLERALADVVNSMQQAERAGSTSATAISNVGTAGEKAASGAGTAKTELTGLAATMEQASRASSGLATSMELVGLEAGTSAQHVRLMNEAIKELAEASVPLLALFAAIEVGTKAFEFLKDAITDASQTTKDLSAIGTMAQAMGGNFREAAEAVDEMADHLSEKTGLAKEEFIKGTQQMVAAGMSVGLAMKSQDAAAAISLKTGRDLSEVEYALVQAYQGRSMELKRLGAVTQEQINSGMTYNQMLQQQEGFMSNGLAQATNNAASQFEILHQKMQNAAEGIGNNFEPALNQLGHDLNDAYDNAGKFTTWLENVAESGPGVATIIAGLSAGIIYLTTQAIIPATGALINFITTMVAEGIVALSNFAKAITVDAVVALFTFSKELIAQGLQAVRTFALAISIEGIGALRTFAMTMIESAIPAIVGFVTTIATVGWPILVAGAAIAGLAYLFATHLKQIEDVANVVINNVIHMFGKLVEAISAAMKFVGGVFGHLGMNSVGDGIDKAADAMDRFGKNAEKTNTSVQAIYGAVSGKVKGAIGAIGNFLTPHAPTMPNYAGGEGLGGGGTGDTDMRMHRGGGSAGGSLSSPTQAQAQDVDALANAHKALADALTASKNAQTAENQTLNQSLTSVQAKAQAEAKLYDAYSKAKNLIPQLVNDVKNEQVAEHNAQQVQQQKYQAYVQSTNALNTLKASLADKGKLTKQEQQDLKAAEIAQKSAETAYKNADTTLKNVTKTLDAHKQLLEQNTKAVNDFIKAQQAIITSYNDRIEAAKKAQQDDEATYGKSLQDQINYYAQRYALAKKADEDFYNLHHFWNQQLHDDTASLYTKLLQLQTQQYDQTIDKQKQAQQQEEDLLQTFFDDITTKGKGFGEFWKSLWSDIVKTLEKAIAQMIVTGQSFKSVFDGIIGGGGGGLFGGLFSFLSGGTKASAATTAATTGTQTATVELGSGTVSKLTGSTSGVSPFSHISSFLGKDVTLGPGSATIGSLALAAVGGGAIGNMIGGMMNNGQNYASIGGSVGGAAGAMFGSAAFTALGLHLGAFAGPLGALGGAVIGSLLGSLFGSHDVAANMPDKYDTQRYGTIVADLTGHAGANGQSFSEQSQLSQLSGGKTGIAWIEETLAQYGSKDKAPAWLQPMFDQLVGMFGMSSTGSGQLNFGHAINNQWVTGATGVDGKTYQYTDLGNALNNFTQAYAQNQNQAANPTTPIFELDRMGPDFNTARLSAWNSKGTTTSGGSGTTTQPVHRRLPIEHPIHIHIENNGYVVGSNGMNEFARQIEERLNRNRFFRYNNQDYDS